MLKGKIDENGCLSIERAGKMSQQTCPFRQQGEYCGDWCPHFGEPRVIHDSTRLNICNDAELHFLVFTDERA